MTIAFRPMLPADRQFVLSGWSSSYRTSPYAGMIRNARWATVMHDEIGAMIDSPDTLVTVAYEPGEMIDDTKEFLYGFIATARAGKPYVYYVYVKRRYRWPKPYRIAARLFEAAGIDPREPFRYGGRTEISNHIMATCTCGKHRHECACSEFTPRYRGQHDAVPARETA